MSNKLNKMLKQKPAMKSIPIKQVILRNPNGIPTRSTTFDLLQSVVDESGVVGQPITTSEQVKRIRLWTEISRQIPDPKDQYEAGENGQLQLKKDMKIDLEDAEYKHLQSLVNAMPWGFSNESIRDFCQQFQETK